jgi:hypothetical protein
MKLRVPVDSQDVVPGSALLIGGVVVHPGLEVGVALVGVVPVAGVSPFAQGGLYEAFGLAVGARG